jgi:hypothetical protein
MSFIVKENTENKESLENVKETLEIPKESLEPEQEEKKDNNNIEEPLKKQRKPKTEKQLAALARGREKAAEGKLRKREELTQMKSAEGKLRKREELTEMKLQLHELQTFKQRVLNDRKTKTQQQEQPPPAAKLVRQQSGQYQQPRQEQQQPRQQQPRQQQRIPEHVKLGMSLNDYRIKLAMDKKYGVI